MNNPKIKNSLFLALVFVAGAAWANALPAEQAEGVLRHHLEGARAAHAGAQVLVHPGEAQAEIADADAFSNWAKSAAAAPVAPPRISLAEPKAVTDLYIRHESDQGFTLGWREIMTPGRLMIGTGWLAPIGVALAVALMPLALCWGILSAIVGRQGYIACLEDTRLPALRRFAFAFLAALFLSR